MGKGVGKRLQNRLISFMGHPNQNLTNLTTRQLMGMGSYINPAAQARDSPREALEGARGAALLGIPDAQKLQKAFTSITQEAEEPYMRFVDCLKQVLESQIDNPDTREILFLKLAIENTKTDCT